MRHFLYYSWRFTKLAFHKLLIIYKWPSSFRRSSFWHASVSWWSSSTDSFCIPLHFLIKKHYQFWFYNIYFDILTLNETVTFIPNAIPAQWADPFCKSFVFKTSSFNKKPLSTFEVLYYLGWGTAITNRLRYHCFKFVYSLNFLYLYSFLSKYYVLPVIFSDFHFSFNLGHSQVDSLTQWLITEYCLSLT